MPFRHSPPRQQGSEPALCEQTITELIICFSSIYTQIHCIINYIEKRIAPERSTEKLYARFCAFGGNEYTL